MKATLKGKKIFVAGGAGFIGSNFIHFLLEKYRAVTILNYDKLTYSGNLDNLRDIARDRRYRFVRADLNDLKRLRKAFQAFRPDYVINFAGETHVDRSIHVGAKEFVDTNVSGVFQLLEAVKAQPKVQKYVQVSTDEVYGSLALRARTKFRETTAIAPNVPYAATKAGGDLLCRAYANTFKTPVVVSRCCNNYGPYQYPEKLIPYFIVRMLESKTLPLYGDGQHVRDWIYVLDHCEALEQCLLRGRPGEIYNIGANSERSNIALARLILRAFNRDESWLEFTADRPGHDRRYAIDATKIRRELGWKPRYRFNDAFATTVQWYLEHCDWIDRVRVRTGVFNPHVDLWRGHAVKINKTVTPKR